jgi:outer membrane protein
MRYSAGFLVIMVLMVAEAGAPRASADPSAGDAREPDGVVQAPGTDAPNAGVTAGSPTVFDTVPRPITLEEAVSMARKNALAVIQAAGQKRTSEADVRSAYAAFLPSVNVSAGATRQVPAQGNRTRIENGQVITVPTDPWSSSVGLGASVTLFEGGRRFFDLKQARTRQVSAVINEEAQAFAATLAAKQQFFNVLAARETELAARAQLAQAEQQARAANARVRARTATRSDSLRAEIQMRSARLAVQDARDAASVAGLALTRIVGSSDPVTAAEGDSLGSADLGVPEGSLRAWADGGPDVRHAEQALSATQAARRSAWAGYLPSVTASYSRGGSGTSPDLSLDGSDFSYSGSMRLSLSLPLFNQLQREGQVTQADVAVHNAEAALRDARLSAREGISQLLVAFWSARDRAASQELNVEAAAEDLRVQQLRYAEGASTLLDLLTSQTQLDQARRDLIRARYDRRVVIAQIEALAGRDL